MLYETVPGTRIELTIQMRDESGSDDGCDFGLNPIDEIFQALEFDISS